MVCVYVSLQLAKKGWTAETNANRKRPCNGCLGVKKTKQMQIAIAASRYAQAYLDAAIAICICLGFLCAFKIDNAAQGTIFF